MVSHKVSVAKCSHWLFEVRLAYEAIRPNRRDPLQVTVEQAERTAHVTGNLRIGKLSLVRARALRKV
eukprot:6210827-Pleurochrysis_carterae.AAC.2